jgi:hypothetical protein
VAYHIQLARKDLDYLAALPHVSPSKLGDILDQVLAVLENVDDRFREQRRFRAGDPCFLFDYVFQDEGHRHQLLFYVDDSHAAAGVLIVAFVDHKFSPLP